MNIPSPNFYHSFYDTPQSLSSSSRSSKAPSIHSAPPSPKSVYYPPSRHHAYYGEYDPDDISLDDADEDDFEDAPYDPPVHLPPSPPPIDIDVIDDYDDERVDELYTRDLNKSKCK
jgi:hypothetical protein